MTSPLTKLLSLGSFALFWGCGGNSPETSSDTTESSPACTTTAECPDGGLCRNEVCEIPTECAAESDCGINLECDLTTNVCVECLEGDDCAEGETCLGQTCRSECSADRGCTGNLVCSDNGFCVECTDDSGCPEDEHCQRGACTPDVCSARGTQCTSDGDVEVCSERGDGTVELQCPENESCGTEQGPAWCQGWICVPLQTTCSEDGSIAELCSDDGLTIAETTDCAANNSVCVEDGCEAIICDPYSTYCKEGDVYECNEHGTVETLARGCFASEYCEEGTSECRSQICTPEVVGCDGGQIATCNSLGSAWENHSACEIDEACELGACEPIVCDASERFCQGGDVRLCNALGTDSSLYTGCSSGEFCNETAPIAVCSTDVCTSGQAACDGDTLGTCNADGSGIDATGTTGTTDCSATGQVCHGGACQDVICTDTERLCVSGDVHQCINKGSATQLYDACNVDEYCDELSATCQPQICTPSAPGCDGEVARVCNADGSDWELGGTDCANLDNKACDAGSCEDVICSPGGRYCDGTEVKTCNSLGTAGTLYQACPDYRFCYESSPTYAYCRNDLCTAGSSICDGEVATTCESDGSGPVAGGTDCTESGDACWQGSCAPPVCTPGQRLCVAGDYHNCIENGTATALYDDCTASEYCDDSLGCQTQLCTPSAAICNGNLITTCESDGSGPVPGGTDCTLSSQACHEAQCKAVVCQEGEYSCDGQDLQLCVDNGTALATQVTCGFGEYCNAADVTCTQQLCDPGQSFCLDNDTKATCTALGDGYDPPVSCAADELCDSGNCVAADSVCSLAGNAWSTGFAIPDCASGGSMGRVGTDAAGNIFVACGTRLFRYSDPKSAWDEGTTFPDLTVPSLMDLKVAPTGEAVAYLRSRESSFYGLWATAYDPVQETWSEPLNLRPLIGSGTWHSHYFPEVSIGVDRAGNFSTVFSHAYYQSSTRQIYAHEYNSADGWSAPQELHSGSGSYSELGIDMLPSGAAIAAWRSGGVVYSALRAAGTGTWGASMLSLNTGSANSAMDVTWTSDAGEKVMFFLEDTSDPFSRVWGPSSGWEAPIVYSGPSLGNLILERVPNGDIWAFADDAIGVLPAGGSSWVDEPNPPLTYVDSVISFPGGDMLATASGGVLSYIPGTGWAMETLPTDYSVGGLAKLPGCRAVKAIRTQLSGTPGGVTFFQ